MLKVLKTYLTVTCVSFFISCQTTTEIPEKIIVTSLDLKVDSLLSKLTLIEKIGQTNLRGTSSRVKGGLSEELKAKVRAGEVGAFLNVMNTEFLNELQRIAVEESPNGIPLIFGRDIIHGFKTIFPIPLGQAATWNPELVQNGARIAAVEGTSKGIRWTFAPMVDVSRDPRWGRIAESAGEDPYLNAEMARAYVQGFQGEDLTSSTSMAACVKHYAAYGAAEGGRDYNSVSLSDEALHNVYLKPFKAAVEENVLTFMTGFNDINGVPASGNKYLLDEVLRGQMKFKGFVVSDWNSITEMINHGYCANEKEAAEKALNAGLNMEMMTTSYEDYVKELLEEGKLEIEQLDDMVRQILRVKFQMGLFDNTSFEDSDTILYHENHLLAAQKTAEESFVLLKNKNNILPLDRNVKIALIGPLADAPHDQLGTWVFDAEKDSTVTPLMSFKEFLGEQNVEYVQALSYSRDKNKSHFREAIRAAKRSDVIVFVGGEESILSGEAHSRADLNLPGVQEELIAELSKLNKPMILVVMAGRPLTITKTIERVDAVLYAWHPGTMGGPALTNVLFGKTSPSGKLPVSWVKEVGQIPYYYNHKMTGRPASKKSFIGMDSIPVEAWQSSLGNESHYLDAGFEPLYPFGFGLSYTKFEYSNFKINKNSLTVGDSLIASVEVKNIGVVEGKEVVQLYFRDPVASLTKPVKELIRFRKVNLKPNESTIIQFYLNTSDFSFYNKDKEWGIEKGEIQFFVGGDSKTTLNKYIVIE